MQNLTETKKLILGVNSSDTRESFPINESGKKPLRDDDYGGFICSTEDQVIVGRFHKGDEHGGTIYRFGKLSIINDDKNEYEVVTSGIMETDYMKESFSKFTCEDGCAIVGREHKGDENGETKYYYRRIGVRKKSGIGSTTKNPFQSSKRMDEYTKTVAVKESAGAWTGYLVKIENTMPEQTYYAPMFAREHDHDENGETRTSFALYEILPPTAEDE
jgi:hypothetical protein